MVQPNFSLGAGLDLSLQRSALLHSAHWHHAVFCNQPALDPSFDPSFDPSRVRYEINSPRNNYDVLQYSRYGAASLNPRARPSPAQPSLAQPTLSINCVAQRRPYVRAPHPTNQPSIQSRARTEAPPPARVPESPTLPARWAVPPWIRGVAWRGVASPILLETSPCSVRVEAR